MKWLFVFLLLVGCAGLPLGMLGGGGPNVAANTQIGKENRQQVSLQENRTEAGRDIITETNAVEADSVEKVEISNTNIPPWVMLLLLIGWLLPTPQQMGYSAYKGIVWLFNRKKRRYG
jgi:hypothetical protein